MEKVFCKRCGRPFDVYTHEKKIECPFCRAGGYNPYYTKPKKIRPQNMFGKLKDEQ